MIIEKLSELLDDLPQNAKVKPSNGKLIIYLKNETLGFIDFDSGEFIDEFDE